jgi:hypothetical protein
VLVALEMPIETLTAPMVTIRFSAQSHQQKVVAAVVV